ncbi:hypothetical protein D3C84_1115370 [compost metagenome]
MEASIIEKKGQNICAARARALRSMGDQRRRASRLKRPAPKATICNRPPAIAMFLKKWMNWF